MPDPYWREHDRPGKTYTLGKAAKDGMLLKVRCNDCRRTVYYLASDLAELYDPDKAAWRPQFPCSTCGSDDCVEIIPQSPMSGDWGNLPVRRPAGIKHTQLWKTVKLGDQT